MGADGARAGVDRVVHEAHPPLPAPGGFVGKLDDDGVGGVARRTALSLLRLAHVLQIEALGAIEREPDRVQRDDPGQDGRAGRGEVADADASVRHPAGDRRADRGEIEIEARGADIGLGGGEISRSDAEAGLLGLEFLATDGLGVDEPPGARDLGLGVGEDGGGARGLGLSLGEGGGIGLRIDHEQGLVGADVLAVAEQHLDDRARDARPQLDVLDGLEAADIFVPVDHVPLQGRRGGHLSHGRSGRLGLGRASRQAAGKNRAERSEQQAAGVARLASDRLAGARLAGSRSLHVLSPQTKSLEANLGGTSSTLA